MDANNKHVQISITAHGEHDNAEFAMTEGIIYTLNLPADSKHLNTVLNIQNNRENTTVNVIGKIICKDKKIVNGLLISTGGCLQLVGITPPDPSDEKCIWETQEI